MVKELRKFRKTDISVSRYFRIQQNQGKQDEGDLSERISEENETNHEKRLNDRNKIIVINTWAVSLMRYGAGIVKWTKSELDETNRKNRNVMTLNKELYPRSDVGRLYGKKDRIDRMQDVYESRRKQP